MATTLHCGVFAEEVHEIAAPGSRIPQAAAMKDAVAVRCTYSCGLGMEARAAGLISLKCMTA